MENVSEDEGYHQHQPNRLGEMAYHNMKERLIRGAFSPGDKLTIRAVSEMLDVSTTPARDAINRLVIDGALIYSGPKTVIVPHLRLSDLQEITQMRLALEGLAAALSVKAASEATIDELEQLQAKIDAALDEKRYFDTLWHNKEFHFAIYRLSGMPYLLQVIETLWLRVGASFNGLYPEFSETRYGARNHRNAIEALVEKDADAARAAIESDIRDGFRQMKKMSADRDQRNLSRR
ncbi:MULTISPECIES: GntR family transcriptional regulator [Rhizobium]|uniref:GntR family transcriptional regulator n=1 Tax=Rhizobium tropici TaxID=398 RepID=A0A329YM61_RHITR|nr:MULTISPECIES: GntR family transcriptional regulator [Rhizobium]MBB3286327.1 DNA-binding GntR family transcriptional regulator [Rhizobium sp. BK252]MBB3401479.1 DNA-binding GntR family transcriptional regulator [Rhizobium sp. BK289]MBB3414057.1 DNA-binding GntR family transcriptional regulator [Rhizobium sp. BK284]MBB3481944.1 DNA-binding GntR family transcriptional regulator [Rhizobium sp. BK347]MDK4719465.1 GntR family transcriptional regulator [Rhizobium sp. CNPSo 3968]